MTSQKNRSIKHWLAKQARDALTVLTASWLPHVSVQCWCELPFPFKPTETTYWDFSPGQIPEADLRPRHPGPFSPHFLPCQKLRRTEKYVGDFSLLYRSDIEEPLGPVKGEVVLRHRSGLLKEKILVSTLNSQQLVPAGAPHNKTVVTSTLTSVEVPPGAVSRRAPRHALTSASSLT